MTKTQWQVFCDFKAKFLQNVTLWQEQGSKELQCLLQKLQKDSKKPLYPIQTPIVYNTALDKITPQSQIKLIIAGDNPGKQEQLAKNTCYLVGHSGKLAKRFFAFYAQLDIDFEKNVIVLNKSPIHSPQTKDLKTIFKNASKDLQSILLKAQSFMAFWCGHLQKAFESPLWLIGYAELKQKGIFEQFAKDIYCFYNSKANNDNNKKDFLQDWDKVFVYQHFSMNRFLIDLNTFIKQNPTQTLPQNLFALGQKHKTAIFSKLSF